MLKYSIKVTQGTKGSASAKRLAEGLSNRLGYKVWRSTSPNPKRRALLYGQGVDKLKQFEFFKENSIPALEFTTEDEQAHVWMHEGHTVVGRKLLNASCGKGIVIMDPEDNGLDHCPVYTKYRKKKREFRVHVFQDKVVRVVEKKLRSNWDGPREAKIRNLANGYVFCSCDTEPEGLRSLALQASGCCASSFKGVDIGYNEKQNQLFVIEVNSAPGIEGSNVEAYINCILEQTDGVQA